MAHNLYPYPSFFYLSKEQQHWLIEGDKYDQYLKWKDEKVRNQARRRWLDSDLGIILNEFAAATNKKKKQNSLKKSGTIRSEATRRDRPKRIKNGKSIQHKSKTKSNGSSTTINKLRKLKRL